jgi:hypothetical protein
MKYMLLITSTADEWKELATWQPDEITRMTGYMNDLIKDLESTGEYVGGEGLGGPARMKLVRGQASGEPLVTDGPMAEAKEFLAGYFTIDVATESRAHEIAARVSAAPGKDGTPSYSPIEVHPIVNEGPSDPEFLEPYK